MVSFGRRAAILLPVFCGVARGGGGLAGWGLVVVTSTGPVSAN